MKKNLSKLFIAFALVFFIQSGIPYSSFEAPSTQGEDSITTYNDIPSCPSNEN